MLSIVVARSAGQGGPRRRSAATAFPRDNGADAPLGIAAAGRNALMPTSVGAGKPHVIGFHTVCLSFDGELSRTDIQNNVSIPQFSNLRHRRSPLSEPNCRASSIDGSIADVRAITEPAPHARCLVRVASGSLSGPRSVEEALPGRPRLPALPLAAGVRASGSQQPGSRAPVPLPLA
jgi:hypothetical protein